MRPLDRNRVGLDEQRLVQRRAAAHRSAARPCALSAQRGSHSCAIASGTTFAVTEITPRAPFSIASARRGIVAGQHGEARPGSALTSSRTRSIAATASLTATMRGSRASRATVAGSRSTAVRDGTLYSTTGTLELPPPPRNGDTAPPGSAGYRLASPPAGHRRPPPTAAAHARQSPPCCCCRPLRSAQRGRELRAGALDQLQQLGIAQGRRLPGGAADHDAAGAGRRDAAQQPLPGRPVDAAVRCIGVTMATRLPENMSGSRIGGKNSIVSN